MNRDQLYRTHSLGCHKDSTSCQFRQNKTCVFYNRTIIGILSCLKVSPSANTPNSSYKKELKAQIEHVKRILKFYSLYKNDIVRQGFPQRN